MPNSYFEDMIAFGRQSNIVIGPIIEETTSVVLPHIARRAIVLRQSINSSTSLKRFDVAIIGEARCRLPCSIPLGTMFTTEYLGFHAFNKSDSRRSAMAV